MMTKLKTYLVAIFTILSYTQGFSCSCIVPSPFCTYAQSALGVLEVEVIKKYKVREDFVQYIDFKVINIISSADSIEYRNLTLKEGRSTCDVYIFNSLSKGDRLIINYDFIDEDKEANFPVVYFSICSINYLRVEKNEVIGRITETTHGEEQRMSLNHFTNNIMDICGIAGFDQKSIKIVNNLTEDFIDIESTYTNAFSFQIYSSSGQLVSRGAIEAQGEQRISMLNYPSGLYFFRFQDNNRHFTLRVMKI